MKHLTQKQKEIYSQAVAEAERLERERIVVMRRRISELEEEAMMADQDWSEL